MIRLFYFAAVLLFTNLILANTDPLSIKLKDSQKLVQTFSADWKQEQAIHIAVLKNKNTKTYDLVPFLADKSQGVQELASLSLEDEPRIESLHVSKEFVTLIVNTKEGQEVLDFALDGSNSRKRKLGDEFENFKVKLRAEGVTHMLAYQEDTLHILSIENSNAINVQKRPVLGKTTDVLNELFDDNLQAIETMEFVEKGSISNSKVYLYDQVIYFTKDDPKASSTALVSVNLTDTTPITEVKVFNQEGISKIKDYNSFLNPEELLALSLGKEALQLRVLPIANPKDQSAVYDNAQLSQSKITANLDAFLKEASRSRNASTITTNATTDGSILVNLSYVNKKSYQYNWWFHNWMFNQMMWQQQMIQNNVNQMMHSVPTGFGPAPIEHTLYSISEEQIQFVITTSGLLENADNAQTNYIQIDKKSYLESLNKVKKHSELSAAFVKDGYSYIYLDKKTDRIELRFSNYN